MRREHSPKSPENAANHRIPKHVYTPPIYLKYIYFQRIRELERGERIEKREKGGESSSLGREAHEHGATMAAYQRRGDQTRTREEREGSKEKGGE